ncbi:hypothetical protein [Cohnella sp. 56]|uniref:hypothetical protein n=1 Tax=Cohnella sp. 56 TaxID=3113722 RepID=UPI0030E8ABF3
MEQKRIAVITGGESDFLSIIEKASVPFQTIKPEEVDRHELDSFDSLLILGGYREQPIVFGPRERVKLEAFIRSGKRVFSEYCQSIGDIYCDSPESTRFEKLAFCAEEGDFGSLARGDLLDDQCNTRLKPYDFSGLPKKAILRYVRTRAHSNADLDSEQLDDFSNMALWFDLPSNLLICNFRISNFVKARFSPAGRWQSIAQFILGWSCGQELDVGSLPPVYRLNQFDSALPCDAQVHACVERAISWFTNANMLVDDGKNGVMEGLATEIYPDGSQRVLAGVRNDCTAETALVFYMNYLRSGEVRNLEISDNLLSLCFDAFQCKEEGHLKGMLRWTQTGWGVCYQDDAARVLIPQLLKNLYSGSVDYAEECVEALRFLVRSTGTDGTRVWRTDNGNLTEQRMRELGSTPARYPSAHYNAYYLGALLLAYKVTGLEEFKEAGVRGMETMMAAYPHTIREHSETQEMCRLILPLSWLYWVTGEQRHKDWLYRVSGDLTKFKHASGGYLEWDTGYAAEIKEGAESSLLANNGDPVVDMLYSLNWLPMGFAQAFLVTKDPYFRELWEEIARFFIAVQIRSGDKMIDGTWTRALDVELMEVNGLVADAGWGPWAIESGWTVAEIASGLVVGLQSEELARFY